MVFSRLAGRPTADSQLTRASRVRSWLCPLSEIFWTNLSKRIFWVVVFLSLIWCRNLVYIYIQNFSKVSIILPFFMVCRIFIFITQSQLYILQCQSLEQRRPTKTTTLRFSTSRHITRFYTTVHMIYKAEPTNKSTAVYPLIIVTITTNNMQYKIRSDIL